MDLVQWLKSASALLVFSLVWYFYRHSTAYPPEQELQAHLFKGSRRLLASEPVALTFCAVMLAFTIAATWLAIDGSLSNFSGRGVAHTLAAVIFLITPLCACGTVAVTLKRLRGEKPTLLDGVRGIVAVGPPLLDWSWRYFSLTPSRRKDLGDAVNFLVPVLLHESDSGADALKRSQALYAATPYGRAAMAAAGEAAAAAVCAVALGTLCWLYGMLIVFEGRWPVSTLVAAGAALVGVAATASTTLYLIVTTAVYLSVAGSPRERARVKELFPQIDSAA